MSVFDGAMLVLIQFYTWGIGWWWEVMFAGGAVLLLVAGFAVGHVLTKRLFGRVVKDI